MDKEQNKTKKEATPAMKINKIPKVEEKISNAERAIQINNAIQVIEKKFGKEAIMLLGSKPNIDTEVFLLVQ